MGAKHTIFSKKQAIFDGPAVMVKIESQSHQKFRMNSLFIIFCSFSLVFLDWP